MRGVSTSTVLTIAIEPLHNMQKAINKAKKQLRYYNRFWQYIFHPIDKDINTHYKQYLQCLSEQVTQLKRHVINTLFTRLEAALEKNDLLFDDVVVDACYAINARDKTEAFTAEKNAALLARPRRRLRLSYIVASLSLIARLGDKQDQKRLHDILTLQRDTTVPLHAAFHKGRVSVYPESRHQLAIGWYRWIAPRSFSVLDKGLPLSMVLRCHQVARIRTQLAQAGNTLDLFPHPCDVEAGYGATPFLQLQAAETCLKAHIKAIKSNMLTGLAKWIDDFFKLGINQKLRAEVTLFEKDIIALQKVKLQCFQRYVNYVSDTSTPLSDNAIVNVRQCAKAIKQSLKTHGLYSGALKLAYTAAHNTLDIVLAKSNTVRLYPLQATLMVIPRRKKQPLSKCQHNYPLWLARAAGLPLPPIEQAHGQTVESTHQNQTLTAYQKTTGCFQSTSAAQKKKHVDSFDPNKVTHPSVETSACQADRLTGSQVNPVKKIFCPSRQELRATTARLTDPSKASASHAHPSDKTPRAISVNNVSMAIRAIQTKKRLHPVSYRQANENSFWVLSELAQGRVPDKQCVNNAFQLLRFYRDHHPDRYVLYQCAINTFLLRARHMISRLIKKRLTPLWVDGKLHLPRYQAIRAMLIGLRSFGCFDDQPVLKQVSKLACHHRRVGLFKKRACRDSVAMLESLITHSTVSPHDKKWRSPSLTRHC